MKKTIVIALMAVFTSSYAFGDAGIEQPAGKKTAPEEAAPAEQVTPEAQKIITEATLKAEEPQYLVGKVDSIIPADLLTRPKSKITITDEAGNQVEFTVKTLAVIYDNSGKIIALDELQGGKKVQIHYKVIADNTKEATSIKVLE